MDYAKNELKFRLEDILNKIDESGTQEDCVLDEQNSIGAQISKHQDFYTPKVLQTDSREESIEHVVEIVIVC